MDDALYQLRKCEENSVVLNGVSAAEQKITEKTRQLMEISDWTIALKHDNVRLYAELNEKRHRLMGISDWATSLKHDNVRLDAELQPLRSSLMFRVLRRVRLIST